MASDGATGITYKISETPVAVFLSCERTYFDIFIQWRPLHIQRTAPRIYVGKC